MRNHNLFRTITNSGVTALFGLLTAFIIAAPAISVAQEQSKTLSLSLQQAEDIALSKSPMLAMSGFDAIAASARWRMEKARKMPSLSTTSFLSNGDMNGLLNGPDSVMPQSNSLYMPQRFYDQSLMFMLPIDYSGKISRNIKAAGRNSAEYSMKHNIAKLDTKLEVRMAYYDVLYHQEHIKVYQDSVKFAQEQFDIDKTSLDVGKVPSYYVDRDKAELAMNQQLLAESQADVEVSKIKLSELMGIDPLTDIQLTDELTTPIATDIINQFPGTTPDITLSDIRVDSSLASLQSARRAFVPDINLTLMSDKISSVAAGNMNGTTAALIVAFPIFDGGMRRAGVNEAKAMYDAANAEKRKAELKSKSDFLSTKIMFEIALKNIDTTGFALKSAEENYKVAKMRYEAGKGILVEMLDAQSSITEARLAQVDAIRNAVVAKDMLTRILGTKNTVNK